MEIKKSDDNKQFTVGSLFAGIGGFCRAFKNAGFRVLWANENDEYAAKSYIHNYPEVEPFFYKKSIRELSVVKDLLEPVDVLTAGFPCQPFSVAGYKLGFKDPRGKLFFEIIRLLREFGENRPKILLMENVANLMNHNNGKTFSKIVEEVQAVGYWFTPESCKVLNTKIHTDIPQNRERLFMVAFSWDAFEYIDFKFPEPVNHMKNVSEFLDLEEKADQEYYFDENSKYGKMFKDAMSSDNNKKPEEEDTTIYLLRRYYVRKNNNNTVFTLTANMGEGGHNVPVIKDDYGIRKLTPKECLRLQGFAEDQFSFPPGLSKSQQYKQIGNAVTIDLVEKLAVECLHKLQSLKGDKK